MRRVLYSSAAIAVFYALIRVVWHSHDATLDIGLAWLTAAVSAGSGAIVAAIDRVRPKPVSADNGGGPRKDAPGG